MESGNDILNEAILGPIEELELGTPMADRLVQSTLMLRNPQLLPRQWLSDPLRQRIDAQLDLPATWAGLRDPAIQPSRVRQHPSVWVLGALVALVGVGLAAWAAQRMGWSW